MLKASEIISTVRYCIAFLRLKTILSYVFIDWESSIKMNMLKKLSVFLAFSFLGHTKIS